MVKLLKWDAKKLKFEVLIWAEKFTVREKLRGAKKEFSKTEDDLKSLQSVGQIIGEVLRPLDNERCEFSLCI